jgi:hypothetical protein
VSRHYDRPIIGRQWSGQWQYKRTTDTSNLVPIASPYRWHQRLMGAVLEMLRALRGQH